MPRSAPGAGLRALAAGLLAAIGGYLAWRVTIVDWSRITAVPALLVDVLGMLLAAMVIGVGSRPPCTPSLPSTSDFDSRCPSLTVDILVPTLHEPTEIIESTVAGALRVRGCGQVWILDDGDRDEVRDLAARLGARYRRRPGNTDAKAGNLNAALPHCDADLLLVLDADQIPLPDILDRLLPYFADPAVALVQTPQGFYNTDSVAFRPDRPVGEQASFYYWLQPAKNRDNSAFWIGSGGILRRAALLDIGGFATAVTEDIHTTLRLHARDWRTVYLPIALSHGLEAGNLHEYYRQRRRWADGNLFILFRTRDSPLCLPGLTLAQRLNYIGALGGHLAGPHRLLTCLLLLLYLVTGQSGVTVPFSGYALATLALGLATMITTTALGRGWHHPLWSEMFARASMLPQTAGLLSGAVAGHRRFSSTRKAVSKVAPAGVKRRYHLLLTLLVGGLAVGLCQFVVTPTAVLAWAVPATCYEVLLLWLLLRHVHRAESGPPGPYEGLTPGGLYTYVVSRFPGHNRYQRRFHHNG